MSKPKINRNKRIKKLRDHHKLSWRKIGVLENIHFTRAKQIYRDA